MLNGILESQFQLVDYLKFSLHLPFNYALSKKPFFQFKNFKYSSIFLKSFILKILFI